LEALRPRAFDAPPAAGSEVARLRGADVLTLGASPEPLALLDSRAAARRGLER
jgi:hypothetical protein